MIIPAADARRMLEAGVARVYTPKDFDVNRIMAEIVDLVAERSGAGAAAAIQRSFLRIFETFGYRKIGLTCKLRNTVCEMGGVADTAQGYVIVQGGGIPSITVMGYNRQVGWEELVGRIKAATQSNVGPVVK